MEPGSHRGAAVGTALRQLFEVCENYRIEAEEYIDGGDRITGSRVESGGYRGHAGVREYFEEISDVWEDLRPYYDDPRTTGPHAVALGGCAVRGRGSGAESDTPMAWVLTVRDGKITSHRAYRTAAEALESVGLQE